MKRHQNLSHGQHFRSDQDGHLRGRRTGFQPVCLQKTGWKPVLPISRSVVSCRWRPSPPGRSRTDDQHRQAVELGMSFGHPSIQLFNLYGLCRLQCFL